MRPHVWVCGSVWWFCWHFDFSRCFPVGHPVFREEQVFFDRLSKTLQITWYSVAPQILLASSITTAEVMSVTKFWKQLLCAILRKATSLVCLAKALCFQVGYTFAHCNFRKFICCMGEVVNSSSIMCLALPCGLQRYLRDSWRVFIFMLLLSIINTYSFSQQFKVLL